MLHNKAILALAAACCLMPLAAQADACRDRIAAMYDGGTLDPRLRPAHRTTNVVTDGQGAHLRTFLSVVESPLRSVSGVEGEGPFALVIDTRSWTGPSLDGPWTEAPNRLPEDRMAQLELAHRQEQANLTDTGCPGTTEIEGRQLEEVRFSTRTDPNPAMGGSWYGARSTVFVDLETDRVLIWRMTDFRNAWSDGANPEVHEITFDYDETIRLPQPE